MKRLIKPLSGTNPPSRFASALAASGALHVLMLLAVLLAGAHAQLPPPPAVFLSLGTMPVAPPLTEQSQDTAAPTTKTPAPPRQRQLSGTPSRPSPALRPAQSPLVSTIESNANSATDPAADSARQPSSAGSAPTSEASTTRVAAGKNSLPYVTYSPTPLYPQEARVAGREGKVRLKVLISENGRVIDVALLQSSGATRLDETAIAALYTWRFHPAYRDDQAIPAWVIVPVVFALR